ncbi:uncharacterized protein [Haliotis cracherodii]|uniref:uncharacterized protein n=1 Tax=Haliotis cracherodii TaxID=6455 RepID=UPI0039E9EA68
MESDVRISVGSVIRATVPSMGRVMMGVRLASGEHTVAIRVLNTARMKEWTVPVNTIQDIASMAVRTDTLGRAIKHVPRTADTATTQMLVASHVVRRMENACKGVGKEYLLPFLASALVLCIGLSAIILWRCKKIRRERLSAMDNGCLEVKTTKEDVFQKCGDIYHEIHDEDLDTNMSLGPAGQRPLPDRPRLPIPLEAVTGAVDHAGSLPETGASGHSSFGYLTPEQTQDVEQPRYTSSRTDDGVYLDVRHSNNTECVVETSFTVTSEEVGKRHLVQGHPSVGTLNHVKMSATLRSDIRTRRCGTKHISWDSRTHLDICAVANDDPQTANKDKAGNRLFKVRPSVCKRAVINPRGSCGF